MPPKRVSLDQRITQETPKAQAADQATSIEPSALWREEAARQEVVTLELTQIMPNPRQPRTIFDQTKLEELGDSIREHGVIQPVIVRPIPLTKWEGHARRYELIAGERRWRASALAERGTIPALIRQDTSDHGSLIELALIENLQRADLHPLEEAMAFGTMRDQLGYSIRRIGERVSRSKGYVENRLKLLDLDGGLQQLISERPDTLMHVGELARVGDPEVRDKLIEAVRGGLSYTETQARVRRFLAPPSDDPTPEVSLRKDSHGRLQNGEHGGSLLPQAPHQLAHPDQETQRRESHVRHQDGEHDASQLAKGASWSPAIARNDPALPSHSRAANSDDLLISLSPQERTSLVELSSKLEAWIDQPERLATDDWNLLASILQHLRDLSQSLKQ